jgi:hypothetical protein
MLRSVTAVQYVVPLREGGSLPALVEADDDGLYVVKLRGAGQGPKALIAELVARVVRQIPEGWLGVDRSFAEADDHRAAYETWLRARVESLPLCREEADLVVCPLAHGFQRDRRSRSWGVGVSPAKAR